ncbi:MAG: transcriptional repressor [Alphaproteobacteria bacterium]|nr:transcriptional repressor [Alphaproteobacteria bacterium]
MLGRAEAVCAQRGAQLTALRRQVLGLILSSDVPMGAYALLDQLRKLRRGAAPPTVYRALEFLLDNNLIHRIERLNAYIGCALEPHGAGHAHGASTEACAGEHEHECNGHVHAAQFLICRSCGTAIEMDDAALEHALNKAAKAHGFTIASASIEAEGTCAKCGGRSQ